MMSSGTSGVEDRAGSNENLMEEDGAGGAVTEILDGDRPGSQWQAENTDNRNEKSPSTDYMEMGALHSHEEACPRTAMYGVGKSPRNSYSSSKPCTRIVFQVLEVFVLSVIVLILLGLYMIPTAYFINPAFDFPPVSSTISSMKLHCCNL